MNDYKFSKTNEIWRDIPNYNGRYQVSNLGRVKTLDRICYMHNGGSYVRKGMILKLVINNKGYYHVNLWDLKKKKGICFRVHILVAISFLSHKPCGMNLVIDHIDGDKLNNSVDNLQITTQRINSSKSLRETYSKYVGVSFDKSRGKWISTIYNKGKAKNLGRYNCELSAHVAYVKQLKKINNERIL